MTVFDGTTYAGSYWDANKKSDQVREVTDAYTPPDAKTPEKNWNVLVMLKVAPFKVTKYVKPIPIRDEKWTKTSRWCSVTGFSVVQKNENWDDDCYRKTYSMTVEACGCTYAGHDVSKYAKTLCSVPQMGYGPGEGDQGAGLVCQDKLVGVMITFLRGRRGKSDVLSPEEKTNCGHSDTKYIFISAPAVLRLMNTGIRVSDSKKASSSDTLRPLVIPIVFGIFLIRVFKLLQS